MITINDFPYNINDLKNACKNKKIIWKEHATQRLLQRKILRDEVIQCILNGEIIENYISDKPFASCLVFGYRGFIFTILSLFYCSLKSFKTLLFKPFSALLTYFVIHIKFVQISCKRVKNVYKNHYINAL